MSAEFILPVFVLCALIPCLWRRKAAYSLFIEGAEEGIKTLWAMFPPVLAVMCAVSMLEASGLWDALIGALSPVFGKLGIPAEAAPLVLVRPLSGSGALGVYSQLLSEYGPDSFAGKAASILMGSTETTFYTMSVYFSRTKVKDSWRILPLALLGDLLSAVLSCFAARWI